MRKSVSHFLQRDQNSVWTFSQERPHFLQRASTETESETFNTIQVLAFRSRPLSIPWVLQHNSFFPYNIIWPYVRTFNMHWERYLNYTYVFSVWISVTYIMQCIWNLIYALLRPLQLKHTHMKIQGDLVTSPSCVKFRLTFLCLWKRQKTGLGVLPAQLF